MIKIYFYNLFLSLDQAINALLGGDCDQSLSGRIGFAMKRDPKWFVIPLAWLNDSFYFWTAGIENHSIESIEPEESNKYETWKWYKG
jgi:hypothetical protein